MKNNLLSASCLTVAMGLSWLVNATVEAETKGTPAESLLRLAGFHGGLIVDVECGDASLAQALRMTGQTLVQGLDRDPNKVAAARKRLRAAGVYGPVTVDSWAGQHLPIADNMVNLVVVERNSPAAEAEAKRVLAPGGVLLTRQGTGWRKWTKPWPSDIDQWTHYLHEADNNAVAQDTRIGPPRSLQWTAAPRWSRHHDRTASMSALVSAGGRVFYVFDEGSTASILLPAKPVLIARDAFNGTLLWKQPIERWETPLWPLKSGPAQLPRRLVATRDTVFATLGIDVPTTALDAATGRILRTYAGTKSTEEILYSKGVLFLLVDPKPDLDKYENPRAVRKPWWTAKPVRVMAVRAESGKVLWQMESSVVPLTLAADDRQVVFHDGRVVVCLDRTTGKVLWKSEPVPLVKRIMSFFAPTLVLQGGVVLFAGGEESGLVKSTGGATKNDTLTALDAATGRKLWSGPHPPSGYSSPEDVFVLGDTVWCEGVSNGNLPGVVIGRDLRTGEVRHSYDRADVQTYWFHHRCYRGKATVKYLMVSRTGIEFIDPRTGHWDINHWTRGGCLYGIMPANGMIYTPPNDCACFPEAKLDGFNALASGPVAQWRKRAGHRLERGPAYGSVPKPTTRLSRKDWPTYRHDAQRTGCASTRVGAVLTETWSTNVGGRLSAVTVAAGKVFVAEPDADTLDALDAASGKIAWRYTAGGRIDSPPTIVGGAAVFGCADGWVYCLRAADGVLIWRFRVAPAESRIVARQRLESRWPVHGSVLVVPDPTRGGQATVFVVAGRSLFLDGGMRFCRLDARTGRLVSETILDDRDPDTGKSLLADTSRLTLPVALPDVLSADARHVYMRSQVFDFTGRRYQLRPKAGKVGEWAAEQQGDTAHLFSSAGFLDGTWFHRSYWMYGRHFEGGWNSYYLAGRRVPAGKILGCDRDHVYGFGRRLQYYRWTTPMEFQLFSSPRDLRAAERQSATAKAGTVVRVEKSPSLNPANKAVTVSAWVCGDGGAPEGVVVARGGGILGYALYVEKGLPRFTITRDHRRYTAVSKTKIGKRWTHLAGLVTAKGQLRVYVNGVLTGTAKAPGPIPRDPADALQIGGDESSSVGPYAAGFPFAGIIDEVRVDACRLPDATLHRLATGTKLTTADNDSLVLYFPFTNGKANDASGHDNRGVVVGAEAAPGKVGEGLRFTGRLPGQRKPAGRRQDWSRSVPILVRALAVAGDKLLLAGPDDLVDEPAAFRTFTDPATQKKLAAQDAAMAGKSGGALMVVSCSDGKTLSSKRLNTIPVWDGLAVANGNVYLAGMDGRVHCFTAAGR